MNIKFQSPRGMKDILPEEQKYFDYFLKKAVKIALNYGFQKITTPIVEKTSLFTTGVGQNTDIVEKELFKILKSGQNESLCLRPENTAGVARAYLENGLISKPQPVQLYYFGPMFRHDKPQAGRFRQFHQFGLEIIGSHDACSDAQIIQAVYQIFSSLGLKDLIIKINNIGCAECRPEFQKLLKEYFKGKTSYLCQDCKRRLRINPLRVLDCKAQNCQAIARQAPQSIDYLCKECNEHFKNILEFLDELDLPYDLDSNLVRGLDYYTKTVFEVKAKQDKTGQGSLAGGGRYDGLIKLFNTKAVPGVGAALGVERIIEQIKLNKIKIHEKISMPQIFLAQIGLLAKKKALRFFRDLQNENFKVCASLSRDSLKSQLRIANQVKAKFTLILGQKEALEETVILRDMKSGSQEVIPENKIIQELKKRLK